MIQVLIVDDEAPARSRMVRVLSQFEDVKVLGEATDGIHALEEIERLKPDLVFLDIEMPELNGIEVASALGPNGPAIVFVTAYNEHALKAFEVCAVDYLVKPVTDVRLQAAVEKVRRRLPTDKKDFSSLIEKLGDREKCQRLAVKCGTKFIVFDPKKISTIISKDHYSAILVDGRELLADDSLDVLSARLNPQQFIRVHRSSVINVEFLVELERQGDRKYVAVLSDAKRTKVQVSRERLAELKNKLGIEI